MVLFEALDRNPRTSHLDKSEEGSASAGHVTREEEAGARRAHRTGETTIETPPNEDEFRQLRRVPGKIPWAAFAIVIIEMFERFSFNGTFVVCA
jgi:POT family proton-dependent oligopeptide transporter